MYGPNADSINYPFIGSNFWAGWEKECHIEYFDRNKTLGFSQEAGLKIHGNFSKAWPQKSFRILAKDDYNEKWIDYNLFPEKPYRKRYKNFNIRNAGIDYNTCHFRDAFMHRATIGLNFERMAYEPCVLFLNGEYWGVYGLRERQDDSYIEENYSNVTKETIDLLRFEGDVMSGSNTQFLQMVDYMDFTDLSIDDNFNFIADNILDVNNVADYFITETYYANNDWIYSEGSNNVKIWRSNNPSGKFRYILWDTDLGLGLIDPVTSVTYNYLGDILSPSYTSVHSRIIQNLLSNQNYAEYFINRYADLMNTTFHPQNMESLAREMEADLEPEMARHFLKWNEGPISIFGLTIATSTNVSEWKNNVDVMVNWCDQRPQIMRDHIQNMIASPNQVAITLESEPLEAGKIKINSIVPDTSGWTGIYFNGIPISLSARPNPGYIFDHWEADNTLLSDTTSISIKLNVTQNITFTAVYKKLDFNIIVYPNPSSDQFTIEYEIPEETQLSINLYGMDGRLEKKLINHSSIHPEGHFTLTLSKSEDQLSRGMHLLRIESQDFTETLKIIVN